MKASVESLFKMFENTSRNYLFQLFHSFSSFSVRLFAILTGTNLFVKKILPNNKDEWKFLSVERANLAAKFQVYQIIHSSEEGEKIGPKVARAGRKDLSST